MYHWNKKKIQQCKKKLLYCQNIQALNLYIFLFLGTWYIFQFDWEHIFHDSDEPWWFVSMPTAEQQLCWESDPLFKSFYSVICAFFTLRYRLRVFTSCLESLQSSFRSISWKDSCDLGPFLISSTSMTKVSVLSGGILPDKRTTPQRERGQLQLRLSMTWGFCRHASICRK